MTHQNAMLREALVAALDHLYDGKRSDPMYNKSEFICNAIRRAWRADKISGDTCEYARDRIQDALGTKEGMNYTFNEWMRERNPTWTFTNIQMQHYRRLWVKQIINYLDSLP